MSDDQLKSIGQVAANERAAIYERTAQANARSQRRSYRIRWTSRCLIIVLGVLSFPLMSSGFEHRTLRGIGTLCLLGTIPLAVVLFFMGGFVPSYKMRRFLSDREKRLLPAFRRFNVRGGMHFYTVIMHDRERISASATACGRPRDAFQACRTEKPLDLVATCFAS